MPEQTEDKARINLELSVEAVLDDQLRLVPTTRAGEGIEDLLVIVGIHIKNLGPDGLIPVDESADYEVETVSFYADATSRDPHARLDRMTWPVPAALLDRWKAEIENEHDEAIQEDIANRDLFAPSSEDEEAA